MKIVITKALSFAVILLIVVSCRRSAPRNSTAHSGTRPNIIVIMSDDMGYSDIGCYGGEISTPNLDSLAAGGLRYTHFYNTGRCCPTRASLLTGLYAHQAGIGQMTNDTGLPGYRGDLSRNAATIAEVLKTAGYSTYMSGKWHVTKHLLGDSEKYNWPLQRGFDRFYGTIIGAGSFYDPWTLTRGNKAITPDNDEHYKPEQYYYTDAISDNAVKYVNDHKKSGRENPFFMYVAYTAAHWPMHALEKDIAKYKGKYDGGYEKIRKARYERMKKLGVIEDWDLSEAPQLWKDFPQDQKAWEIRCMEVYAAMVDNMDQGIGRLVKSLKKNGQYENTLILFFQDNGGCAENRGRSPRKDAVTGVIPMDADELQTEMVPFRTRAGQPVLTGPDVMPGPSATYIAYGRNWANVSNTPFRQYKSQNHEGGIATPLIAHWPKGIKAKNELRDQAGHLIDIMATCVDLSGATYPKKYNSHKIQPMEGQTLAASFDSNIKKDRLLIWEHYKNCAIRQGKWKLVKLKYKTSRKDQAGQWELYDMDKDRSELNDLVKVYPEKAKELEALWEKHAHRTKIYPKPGGSKKKKPNFIFIFADDLGYGDLACYGSTRNRTPHIDKMAAEGMRFTDFYVTSGVCTPSRSSLMTGCYPRRVNLHVDSNDKWVLFPNAEKGLNPNEITVAEVLKKQGYATACIGKWHLGDQKEFLPTRQGFDYYYGIPYSNDMDRSDIPLPLMRNEQVIQAPANQPSLTQDYTKQAIEFIENNRNNPFFLYLPHTMVHLPLQASEKFKNKSANGRYGDAVEEIDWSTGEILNKLRELGIDENTMVIFSSDNGSSGRRGGSNAPLRGGKGNTDEGSMRVPCIVRYPGEVPANTLCRELASTIDILPTFAKLGDAKVPKDRTIDGKNIWPLMSGLKDAKSPHRVFYYYHTTQLQAVRSGKWKLILPLAEKKRGWSSQENTPLKLINLQDDIHEDNDLSKQFPEVVDKLMAFADNARADLGDMERRGTDQREAGWIESPTPRLLKTSENTKNGIVESIKQQRGAQATCCFSLNSSVERKRHVILR